MSDPSPHLNPTITATHASPATLSPCGSTRLPPSLRARLRARPKALIPTLTPDESVALARFIHAATARNIRPGWRTAFDDCIGRGHFRPFATPEQTRLLRSIVQRHGPLFHCYLRSADVLAAAHLSFPPEVDPKPPPEEDTS